MNEEKPSVTPDPKTLFTASNAPEANTQTATLKLEDEPLTKLAGCLSFDYYNITFKCQVTRQHLGKFLDFLLNAEWKDQWGTISIDEILKVEKAQPPVYTDISEES